MQITQHRMVREAADGNGAEKDLGTIHVSDQVIGDSLMQALSPFNKDFFSGALNPANAYWSGGAVDKGDYVYKLDLTEADKKSGGKFGIVFQDQFAHNQSIAFVFSIVDGKLIISKSKLVDDASGPDFGGAKDSYQDTYVAISHALHGSDSEKTKYTLNFEDGIDAEEEKIIKYITAYANLDVKANPHLKNIILESRALIKDHLDTAMLKVKQDPSKISEYIDLVKSYKNSGLSKLSEQTVRQNGQSSNYNTHLNLVDNILSTEPTQFGALVRFHPYSLDRVKTVDDLVVRELLIRALRTGNLSSGNLDGLDTALKTVVDKYLDIAAAGMNVADRATKQAELLKQVKDYIEPYKNKTASDFTELINNPDSFNRFFAFLQVSQNDKIEANLKLLTQELTELLRKETNLTKKDQLVDKYKKLLVQYGAFFAGSGTADIDKLAIDSTKLSDSSKHQQIFNGFMTLIRTKQEARIEHKVNSDNYKNIGANISSMLGHTLVAGDELSFEYDAATKTFYVAAKHAVASGSTKASDKLKYTMLAVKVNDDGTLTAVRSEEGVTRSYSDLKKELITKLADPNAKKSNVSHTDFVKLYTTIDHTEVNELITSLVDKITVANVSDSKITALISALSSAKDQEKVKILMQSKFDALIKDCILSNPPTNDQKTKLTNIWNKFKAFYPATAPETLKKVFKDLIDTVHADVVAVVAVGTVAPVDNSAKRALLTTMLDTKFAKVADVNISTIINAIMAGEATTNPTTPSPSPSVAPTVDLTTLTASTPTNIIANMNTALEGIYNQGVANQPERLRYLARELAFDTLDAHERTELANILRFHAKDDEKRNIAGLVDEYLTALDKVDTNETRLGVSFEKANDKVSFAADVTKEIELFNTLLSKLSDSTCDDPLSSYFNFNAQELRQLTTKAAPLPRSVITKLDTIKSETGIDIRQAFKDSKIDINSGEGKALLQRLFEAANKTIRREAAPEIQVAAGETLGGPQLALELLYMTKYNPLVRAQAVNTRKFLDFFNNPDAINGPQFASAIDAERQIHLAQVLMMYQSPIEEHMTKPTLDAARTIYEQIPGEVFNYKQTPQFFMHENGQPVLKKIYKLGDKANLVMPLAANIRVSGKEADKNFSVEGDNLALKAILEATGVIPVGDEEKFSNFIQGFATKNAEGEYSFDRPAQERLATELARILPSFVETYNRFSSKEPANDNERTQFAKAKTVIDKLLEVQGSSTILSVETGYIKISFDEFLDSFTNFVTNMKAYRDVNEADIPDPSIWSQGLPGGYNTSGTPIPFNDIYAAWRDNNRNFSFNKYISMQQVATDLPMNNPWYRYATATPEEQGQMNQDINAHLRAQTGYSTWRQANTQPVANRSFHV